MLVGAHVSPAGGPANAIGRGVERHATSIQFFNQSPRAWRSRVYTDDEAAAFREAAADSPIKATLITPSTSSTPRLRRRDLRRKSLTALTNALRSGDAIGAYAVVLHLEVGEGGRHERRPIEAVGKVDPRGAGEQRRLPPLHLENTAGAGAPLGRCVRGARRAPGRGGRRPAAPRIASTPVLPLFTARWFGNREPEGRRAVDRRVLRRRRPSTGWPRLADLNDSADTGSGPAGTGHAERRHARSSWARRGARAFLSEPRFERPAVRDRGPGQRPGRALIPKRSSSPGICASRACGGAGWWSLPVTQARSPSTALTRERRRRSCGTVGPAH